MKVGTRVRINEGMREFIGSTGTVICHEQDGRTLLNRVRLDSPVEVPMVGLVKDDLWANEFLTRLRS